MSARGGRSPRGGPPLPFSSQKVLKIPVPLHTKLALNVLEKIKFTESDYAIDALKFTRSTYKPGVNDYEANLMGQESLNRMLRNFASHFDIPFEIPGSTDLYSAHSYRSTVAGWLGSYSNLSVLLVRRLFGYSNDVTPMVYLSKNPGFIQEQHKNTVCLCPGFIQEKTVPVSMFKNKTMFQCEAFHLICHRCLLQPSPAQ